MVGSTDKTQCMGRREGLPVLYIGHSYTVCTIIVCACVCVVDMHYMQGSSQEFSPEWYIKIKSKLLGQVSLSQLINL